MFNDINRPIVIDNNIPYLINLDIPGRKTSVLFIIQLAVLGAFSSLFYMIFRTETSPIAFLPQSICLFLLLLTIGLRKFLTPRPHNILSPDIIFISMFCVFHFGYIVLYSLKMVEWVPEVFWAPDKVMVAVLFCTWCLIFFLIGYELPGTRFANSEPCHVVVSCSPILIQISQTIIFVALFFFWLTLFSVGISRVLSDYEILINVGIISFWGKFFWLAHDLGVIGIAMYCASSAVVAQKTMHGFLFKMLTFMYIVGLLVLGDRGGFIQVFIIPVIVFHYFQRRIKLMWIALLVVILLVVMAIIGITRTMTGQNPAGVVSEYRAVQKDSQHNVLTRSILEFGASLKTVVIAMDLVPSRHPYWYGTSYLESSTVVVPNIIPGIIRESKGVDAWLTETAFGSLQATHGRGGSIAMEAYMNFGFIGGVLFFALIGYCYRWLYERVLSCPNFMKIVTFLGVTAGLTLWMRNTMGLFVRPAVWTVIFAWIFYVALRNKSEGLER